MILFPRGDGHGYGAWTEAGSQTHSLSQTEDDQMHLSDVEQDPANWQQLVSRDVLSGLKPHEIKRQEVINGKARVSDGLGSLRIGRTVWFGDKQYW